MFSNDRQRGLTFSVILHLILLVVAVFGLPSFWERLPEEPAAITVEILPITGITNVKPSDSQPSPVEKPEDKKPEPKKPTPPVKTEDSPPPPQDNAVPLPKPEPKKPEPKKEEKKPDKPKKDKAKAEDLDAVLKAVKDTAQKESKDPSKDKTDTSKSKSRSNQYNANMPMSMSEKDAIRSQIAQCWSVPAGAKDAQDLAVVLELQLEQDGTVIKVQLANVSKSRYSSDSFFRAAAESAMRAVRQCSPLKNLPPDKYDTWRDMELTFDPKEMLF